MAPIKRVSYRTGFVQRLEEVGGMPAIAAYNADTDRVEAARGVPPIAETRQYLARVFSYRLTYLRRNGR